MDFFNIIYNCERRREIVIKPMESNCKKILAQTLLIMNL